MHRKKQPNAKMLRDYGDVTLGRSIDLLIRFRNPRYIPVDPELPEDAIGILQMSNFRRRKQRGGINEKKPDSILKKDQLRIKMIYPTSNLQNYP